MTDDKLVKAVARAIGPVLERDNMIYWAAERGHPVPQESLVALATAALAAYRQCTQDDGK